MPENPRIEELRRRVQADPASIAFAALAEEFRRMGRLAEAIETCRTGLQRHPAYLSARVTLGRALLETGEYDAAREELETVLRSAPENLAAIRGLEQINERLGHSTEMHADLHEMMREPIRLATQRPPAPSPTIEPPGPDPTIAAPEAPRPLNLDAFDQPPESSAEPSTPPAPAASDESAAAGTGEAFDIFAAALKAAPLPPAPVPLMTFEPSTIAFEAPTLTPAASGDSPRESADLPRESLTDDSEDVGTGPDAHVAATLNRLERFLGAIESARHP